MDNYTYIATVQGNEFLSPLIDLWTCTRCGAVVSKDTILKHNEWHNLPHEPKPLKEPEPWLGNPDKNPFGDFG